MNNHQLWLAFLWVTLIVIGSCARRGTPTGGEKDTIPPVLVRMVPALETVNFDDDEIELEFNELIQARDLKRELIITPPIEDYSFYTKKNFLYIQLEEELQDSTTYTFNFGEAIQDLSEGNEAENAIAAFSTGAYIDSFQVSGTVRQLLTQEPAEDAIIALYDIKDTLDVFTGPPTYFAKANEEGQYTIRYIKPGSYRIYAYTDNNSNMKVEASQEPYGFLVDTLNIGGLDPKAALLDSLLSTDLMNLDLSLTRKNTEPLQLQSSRANGKYYELKFNKGLEHYSLQVDEDNLAPATQQFIKDSLDITVTDSMRYLFYNLQDERQMIRVYNTLRQDSLRTVVSVVDSTEQAIRDSVVYVQFAETRRKVEDFATQFEVGTEAIEQTIKSSIKFNKPVIRVNTDSILLSYDTLYYLPIDYEKALVWNDALDEVAISIVVNTRTLVDSVLFYQRRNDSIAFTERQQLARAYLDSLKQTNEVEKQRKLLQALAQVRSNDVLSALQDSVANTENEAQVAQMVRAYTDTATIDDVLPPRQYDRQAISNDLKNLNFYAAPGSFMSIEQDSSQAIVQRYTFIDPEEYGLLSGTIDLPYEHFFLQLLDENYEVVRELENPNRYTFRMVPPGTYLMRVLVDADNDGEWEDGNILQNEEPEPVFIYSEPVSVRENWEVNDVTIDNTKLSTLSSE